MIRNMVLGAAIGIGVVWVGVTAGILLFGFGEVLGAWTRVIVSRLMP